MTKTIKLFQKEVSQKFRHLSAIDRKAIVLRTGFILLLTCTITGCGSNKRQQSTLPVTEQIPIENSAQEETAQEEPTQAAPNQSVPEQAVPEQPSQAEDSQSQISSGSQPVPEAVEPESEAEMADPVPDESAASPSYFGTWQITSSTFGAYSAMSEEACSALVGTCFEYFEEYAVYDDQHRLDSPQYFESTQTADDFSYIYAGSSLEMLGISKDSIQVVAIENASGIGDTFYIKDENTLIIPWDGVFFEVQRVSTGS